MKVASSFNSYDRSEAIAQVREEIAQNNGEITFEKPTGIVRADVHNKFEALEKRINVCFTFDY